MSRHAKKSMVMGETKYELIKHFVTIVLPAMAALYSGLAVLWSLPYAAEVVGTISLIATFLGVALKISSVNYYSSNGPRYDGVVDVTEGAMDFQLNQTEDRELRDLADQKEVIFKVNRGH